MLVGTDTLVTFVGISAISGSLPTGGFGWVAVASMALARLVRVASGLLNGPSVCSMQVLSAAENFN